MIFFQTLSMYQHSIYNEIQCITCFEADISNTYLYSSTIKCLQEKINVTKRAGTQVHHYYEIPSTELIHDTYYICCVVKESSTSCFSFHNTTVILYAEAVTYPVVICMYIIAIFLVENVFVNWTTFNFSLNKIDVGGN